MMSIFFSRQAGEREDYRETFKIRKMRKWGKDTIDKERKKGKRKSGAEKVLLEDSNR